MSNPIQIADARRARLPRLVPKFAPSPANDYTEFLPAHLEILETPASPKTAFMIWTLCGLLTTAMAWSFFAHIDIYAEAQGRIQPSGRSKVVQPVDTGRVRKIAVSNGSRVKAGDVLIELDPTESSADRDAARSEMDSLVSEIARRKTEIAGVQSDVDDPTLMLPDNLPAEIADRDQKLFRAEMNQYVGTRETLIAQVAEKTAHNERLRGTIGPRERVVALMRERVGMRSTLESTQSGTHAAVIDASQLLENELRNLADDKGQVLENDAATVSLQRRLEQTKTDFLATQNQHLTDAERRRMDVAQNLIKASVREQRTRLVAPIDGVVQQLAVTTVGQVVTVGQPLLVVVPSDATLEVMALIENKDVGFIKVGQEVVVKVDSFPFTRYGTLKGTVKRISMEAIDSQEATASSDASTLARPNNNSSLASTPRVQNLVYPVSIELEQTSLRVDDQQVPLLPGMMATSEIRTGSRRVIGYLLAPVWEASSQAAHER